jgi:hypothetical protein
MAFPDVRKAMAAKVEVALESAGFLLSLAGASLAAAFGRFLLALLLAGIALGMGLRLVGRQRLAALRGPRMPRWVRAVSLALSVAEMVLLIVATDWPVGFHQEGFSYVHWTLVLLALAMAYFVQVRVLAGLWRRLSHARA